MSPAGLASVDTGAGLISPGLDFTSPPSWPPSLPARYGVSTLLWGLWLL